MMISSDFHWIPGVFNAFRISSDRFLSISIDRHAPPAPRIGLEPGGGALLSLCGPERLVCRPRAKQLVGEEKGYKFGASALKTLFKSL